MKLPKLLDCTLRDGGYINNWAFSRVFGSALYQAVSAAGCDFVEVGFFDPQAKAGLPWTNLSVEDVDQLRANVSNGSKVAVMINYGSVSLEEVPLAKDYPVDMIRVATPQQTAAEATEFAAALSKKGYATTINYMGVSNYSNGEILELLELMNRYKDEIDYFYVADSFGSLMPKRTREIFTALRFGTDAALGFHPHNNLQLAFANCLEAMEAGVDIIDGSVFGMGRGAGNLFTDAILAYYEQQDPDRYRLVPILQFADLHMQAQRAAYSWGYSLPQLLSGVFHCHPNYPTYLLREKAYTADDIYKMLRGLPEPERARYSAKQMEGIKELYINDLAENATSKVSRSISDLCVAAKKRALLVCGGNSVMTRLAEIQDFIQEKGLSVFAVNNPQAPFSVDGVFFGNRRRVLQYFDKIDADLEVIFGPEIHAGAGADFSLKKVSRVNSLQLAPHSASPYPMALPSNSAIEAILGLVQIGYNEVFICGLDGYVAGEPSHYYQENDAVNIPEEIEKQNSQISEELRITKELSKELGFSFSIITPTIFSEYIKS
ncbi:MAG: aldolase catalytic domain-containing protein [Opitutales bacterium]|jgi:4-hydroxy 2-oxovalerate aldolase|nr:aldolase catalytic domain-containing protein [Opitutales bacterium]MDP4644014.1 aldolase catalytic domain-containing protein [Opitutales bacterium]MDP4777040.1 aldolase catalytic domain-containing protein [Opitutales bacterium]MDP4882664.1 aldolase catalytic domain-containing protein [Opitutales bacterium]MDP5080961.1 aldolase catalytic domain-containing protein [Opitutales bacterium]